MNVGVATAWGGLGVLRVGEFSRSLQQAHKTIEAFLNLSSAPGSISISSGARVVSSRLHIRWLWLTLLTGAMNLIRTLLEESITAKSSISGGCCEVTSNRPLSETIVATLL